MIAIFRKKSVTHHIRMGYTKLTERDPITIKCKDEACQIRMTESTMKNRKLGFKYWYSRSVISRNFTRLARSIGVCIRLVQLTGFTGEQFTKGNSGVHEIKCHSQHFVRFSSYRPNFINTFPFQLINKIKKKKCESHHSSTIRIIRHNCIPLQ